MRPTRMTATLRPHPMRTALLLLLSFNGAVARILVTPPAAAPIPQSVVEQPPPEDPCAINIVTEPEEEEEELEPCVCYPLLPSKCTRLLRSGSVRGVVVPTATTTPGSVALDECGARIGDLVIAPDSCQGGYYGHDATLDPADVLARGLPARGSDWDLLRHAEQAGDSAFRGTTKLVTFPDGNGAAAWADEGGYVYELTCLPSWDVNKHIQGRRLVADLAVGRARFGGNLALGEHEHAVPARVPAAHIKRYGAVVASSSGVLFVPRNSWIDNPRWDPCFCKFSLSDCDGDAPPCH